jgi:hypothetical protein
VNPLRKSFKTGFSRHFLPRLFVHKNVRNNEEMRDSACAQGFAVNLKSRLFAHGSGNTSLGLLYQFGLLEDGIRGLIAFRFSQRWIFSWN